MLAVMRPLWKMTIDYNICTYNIVSIYSRRTSAVRVLNFTHLLISIWIFYKSMEIVDSTIYMIIASM